MSHHDCAALLLSGLDCGSSPREPTINETELRVPPLSLPGGGGRRRACVPLPQPPGRVLRYRRIVARSRAQPSLRLVAGRDHLCRGARQLTDAADRHGALRRKPPPACLSLRSDGAICRRPGLRRSVQRASRTERGGSGGFSLARVLSTTGRPAAGARPFCRLLAPPDCVRRGCLHRAPHRRSWCETDAIACAVSGVSNPSPPHTLHCRPHSAPCHPAPFPLPQAHTSSRSSSRRSRRRSRRRRRSSSRPSCSSPQTPSRTASRRPPGGPTRISRARSRWRRGGATRAPPPPPLGAGASSR